MSLSNGDIIMSETPILRIKVALEIYQLI